MKNLVIVFIAIIIVEITMAQILPWPSQSPIVCGENEVYIQCSSRANRCEPSCDNPTPTVCTLMCKAGCDCLPGFLRSKNGKCVLPNQCFSN